MQPAYYTTATVQEGGRLEIEAPELTPGDCVEVFVVTPKRAETNGNGETKPERLSTLDIAASLPPGPHGFATWEEYERFLQEEKNSWDR